MKSVNYNAVVRKVERGAGIVGTGRRPEWSYTQMLAALKTQKFRNDLIFDLARDVAAGKKMFPLAAIPLILQEVETIVHEASGALEGFPKTLSGKQRVRLFTDALLEIKLRALARLRKDGDA